MQVLFESRDPAADELREVAERRVRFAMRRLAWVVPRARVQLSDLNGPRGGADKHCRLELNTDATGTVIVTSVARDWRCALDTALARAARSLVQGWRGAAQRHLAQTRPPVRAPLRLAQVR